MAAGEVAEVILADRQKNRLVRWAECRCANCPRRFLAAASRWRSRTDWVLRWMVVPVQKAVQKVAAEEERNSTAAVVVEAAEQNLVAEAQPAAEHSPGSRQEFASTIDTSGNEHSCPRWRLALAAVDCTERNETQSSYSSLWRNPQISVDYFTHNECQVRAIRTSCETNVLPHPDKDQPATRSRPAFPSD